MKHEIKKLEQSAIEVKMILDKEEFNPMMDKIVASLSKEVDIPGFRKGHAPKDKIIANYKDKILEELVGEVLNNKFADVVKEEKISPVSYARIKDNKLTDDALELVFDIDVYPEFELAEYKGLEAEKSTVEVTDEMLNNEIEFMLTRQSKFEEVADADYKAQLGDTVDLDFEGFIDGVAFAGGKAEHHSLELGSKSFIDTFEDQLVGYTKGQEGEVNVTFPAEYHSEELAGKPAVFKVKVNAIKKLIKAELNEEFAKANGHDTVEAFKEAKKAELVEAENRRAEQEFVGKLIEKIAQNTEVAVPKSMVMAEVEQQLRQFEYQLSMQGMKLQDYVQMTGGKIDDLVQQIYPSAENKVKVDLILHKIVEKENITVSDEEATAKMTEIAKMYGMELSALENELKKNNNLENFKISVNSELLMSKAVELIKAAAVVK